ncbi:hypothetical protein NPX13_g2073 [Xylaria arbuscula]|uniref:Xylanolytic transcriptional activator regulatory domain-containing protein n=1 Tax=Xylaria arbuscula TaxID=114810 RepID=A0A9W8TP28_9PEZI|nr:hypothetical protein NPX13_g2073 [Xylaria arbuscula]
MNMGLTSALIQANLGLAGRVNAEKNSAGSVTPVYPNGRISFDLLLAANISFRLRESSLESKPTDAVGPNDQSDAALPEFYIDQILSQARVGRNVKNGPFAVKGNELFDNRLRYISKQLRNNKVEELLHRISSVVQSHLPRHETAPSGSVELKKTDAQVQLSAEEVNTFVTAYFRYAHPTYPFLDQSAFQDIVSKIALNEPMSKACSILYHAVLAIGCQISGGGSFLPRQGKSWALFAVALAAFPDILMFRDSVEMLQALAAMSLYTLSISCMAMEHIVLSEAARRAQNLRGAKLSDSAVVRYQRAFWTIYCIDKVSSFHFGRPSMFADHQIIVPLPILSATPLGEFNWILTVARYARLLSKSTSSLFSVGATGRPTCYYISVIQQFDRKLEEWYESIPSGYRSASTADMHFLQTDLHKLICVWTRLMYNSFKLTLCRARLQIAPDAEATRVMLATSRSTLEVTSFLNVHPSTPFWLLAGIPLVSLLVLFDFVISNPKHPETSINLALLDVAGGHFSKIEYASKGWLPGSLITEFSHIAREYVNNQGNLSQANANDKPCNQANPSSMQQNLQLLPLELEAKPPTGPPTTSSFDIMTPTVNHEALPPDILQFSGAGSVWQLHDGLFSGTDVLGIFNSFIPEMDLSFPYPTQDSFGLD